MHRWCASYACGPSLARRIATRFTSFPTKSGNSTLDNISSGMATSRITACLLLSGFAYRHKSAGNGGRQILSIHMKGDLVDLQNSLLGTADHNVQMLTAGEVALIPIEPLRDILPSAVRRSAWRCGMKRWSKARSSANGCSTSVGATRAPGLRICCASSPANGSRRHRRVRTNYELPITQEQLADAVALTPVHVNRTLMKLEQEGLITRTKRMIRLSSGKRW